jgi:hypothetical protein
MDAQRLLTTQPDAFSHAEPVDGPSPEETWRLVEATHACEWEEVAAGRLGARGVSTSDGEEVLEESVVENGRLRLKPACHYCDYGVLCGRTLQEGA